MPKRIDQSQEAEKPVEVKVTRETAPAPSGNVAEWDTWMYSAEGPKLFKAGDEIPEGYQDTPVK